MKIFYIQDPAGSSAHVVAEDWQEALVKWRKWLCGRGEDIEEKANPQSITMIADGEDDPIVF